MSSDALEIVRLPWLEATIDVACDHEPFARRLAALLGGKSAPLGAAASAYAVRLAGERPELVTPSATVPLDTRYPAAHATTALLGCLFGGVGNAFVLHAAALERSGRALVVSAPSAFGKTTLSIRLARRGFRLLSDDVAVLDRKLGTIAPFRKAMTLREGTRESLPEELRRRARAARRFDDGGGEWLVDAEVFLGARGEPAAPATVVIFRLPEDAATIRRFPVLQVRFVTGRRPAAAELAAIPGVARVEEDETLPEGLMLYVADPIEVDDWLAGRQADLAYVNKLPGGTPEFDREPEARPISTLQAVIELAQEMLNRAPGSRIGSEFAGRETHMVMELSGLFALARCHSMVPGRLDATLDRLEALFEDA